MKIIRHANVHYFGLGGGGWPSYYDKIVELVTGVSLSAIALLYITVYN